MTSASELFSNWRSRSGSRNPNPHLAVNSTFPSDPHRLSRRRPSRRLHGHGDDCAGPSRHRLLETDHELLQSNDNSPNDLRTGSNSNAGTVRIRVNQLTLTRSGQGNERLPDTVLQARSRLLERLHGISLTANRQNVTASNISRNESFIDNESGIIDSGDWEIGPGERIESDANGAMFHHNVSKKKPQGLSWETIHSLPLENFKDEEEDDYVMGASRECCICLERFWEGDRLFRLTCDHRFHPSCLEPWLQNSGECPYCRASI